ncbi:hypothetical protein ACFCZC_20625 [Bacillus subtilis]
MNENLIVFVDNCYGEFAPRTVNVF